MDDALVASRCGSFATFQPELGDDPVAVAVAVAVAEDLVLRMEDQS